MFVVVGFSVSIDLIDSYISAKKKTDLSLDDYASRLAVNRSNRAAMKMRRIALKIDESDFEVKNEFAKMLDIREYGEIVAHHILELMNYDTQIQRRALSVIEEVACGDELVASLGNRMWLVDWYKKHPEFAPNETVLRKLEDGSREAIKTMSKIAHANEELRKRNKGLE